MLGHYRNLHLLRHWLQVGSGCGQKSQACCLVPAAGADPRSNIRAKCNTGLTCIVRNTDSLPYGSSRHAQGMLAAAANSSLAAVLRTTHVMGVCEQLSSALSVSEDKAVLADQQSGLLDNISANADNLFMPCGYTSACGAGSWCAGGLSGLTAGTQHTGFLHEACRSLDFASCSLQHAELSPAIWTTGHPC
jgi:hypothetical protein